MTPETASRIFPVMKAFSEGKTVQFKNNLGLWKDAQNPFFSQESEWRVKPDNFEAEFVYCPINSAGGFAGYPRKDFQEFKDCETIRFATCPEGYEVRKIKDNVVNNIHEHDVPETIQRKLPPLPHLPFGYTRWVARGFGWKSGVETHYASLRDNHWTTHYCPSAGTAESYYIEAIK